VGVALDEPGRLLVGVYALFVVAAGARSLVQIATRFSVAPLAYALSGVAALVYLTGTVLLRRAHRAARVVACAELAGVLVVGTLSLVVPSWFPDATVWSAYGMGYGFVPLLLPVCALWWLRARAA
jgi:hypothetical protein